MSALTVRDANYFRSFKFTDNAKLVVPESGLYCVYAQIFLNAKLTVNRNQVVIFAENSLLPFAAQHLRNFHLSGGGGGGGRGFYLEEGQEVQMKPITCGSVQMWVGQQYSAFGLYKI